ncbi:MAG: hypothetical protein D6806_10585, partial [Deltaproteobacteria bacterium]
AAGAINTKEVSRTLRNDSINWTAVTFWSGLGALSIGAVSGVLAWKFGRDYRRSGSSLESARSATGLMWAAGGTGVALLLTSLVLEIAGSDDEKDDVGISASAFAAESTVGISIAGRW